MLAYHSIPRPQYNVAPELLDQIAASTFWRNFFNGVESCKLTVG
jgi:hypothetical protein